MRGRGQPAAAYWAHACCPQQALLLANSSATPSYPSHTTQEPFSEIQHCPLVQPQAYLLSHHLCSLPPPPPPPHSAALLPLPLASDLFPLACHSETCSLPCVPQGVLRAGENHHSPGVPLPHFEMGSLCSRSAGSQEPGILLLRPRSRMESK